MGDWSHLGIWRSGIGCVGGSHGTLEPPGDLAVGYRWVGGGGHGTLETWGCGEGRRKKRRRRNLEEIKQPHLKGWESVC